MQPLRLQTQLCPHMVHREGFAAPRQYTSF